MLPRRVSFSLYCSHCRFLFFALMLFYIIIVYIYVIYIDITYIILICSFATPCEWFLLFYRFHVTVTLVFVLARLRQCSISLCGWAQSQHHIILEASLIGLIRSLLSFSLLF